MSHSEISHGYDPARRNLGMIAAVDGRTIDGIPNDVFMFALLGAAKSGAVYGKQAIAIHGTPAFDGAFGAAYRAGIRDDRLRSIFTGAYLRELESGLAAAVWVIDRQTESGLWVNAGDTYPNNTAAWNQLAILRDADPQTRYRVSMLES